MLVTHPNNQDLVERSLGRMPVEIRRLIGDVNYCPYMQERWERWEPPAASRFVEFGPEDEGWARRLGLGTVRGGPLIYNIDAGFFTDPIEIEPVDFQLSNSPRLGLFKFCTR